MSTDFVNRPFNRREFLSFMGRTGAAVALASPLLSACNPFKTNSSFGPYKAISPSQKDDLILSPGLKADLLIEWGQVINTKGDRFGFNNDYTHFHSTDDSNGILWVNHEYPSPLFVSGYSSSQSSPKTKQQVDLERKAVGGSILRIQKNPESNLWSVVANDKLNRRIDANTPIKLVSDEPISGTKTVIGTFSNCAGGYTPWGSILTCEENYDLFYGDKQKYQWEKHYPFPSEHYGWVVEVDLKSGASKKLTSLGRFAHESATVVQAADGRCVVYSGDDAKNECLYKFISDRSGSLERGKLYVADTKNGKWLHLDHATNPILNKAFKSQTDLLIHARKASHLIGATELDRPEDIEQDPKTGAIYVALTNNSSKDNHYGSILKIEESNNDPLSLNFKASTFITGGKNTSLACPDNLAFDPSGNLWISTDISGSVINHGHYAGFGNNALFFVPMSGENAGSPIRVASAPINAEFTGMSFTPDGKTLFLSVQHPGEYSKSIKSPLSHWPHGGNSTPKPAVVQIQIGAPFRT